MKYNSHQTITLAPWEVQAVPVTGSCFFCVAATNSFQLSVDGGEQFEMVADKGFNLGTDKFTKLIFHNPTPQSVNITFDAGTVVMVYWPTRTNTVGTNAPTYLKGSDPVNLAAGASNNFSGVDGGNNRKQFILYNGGAAGQNLYVLDAAGKVAGMVLPQSTWTTELSGLLKVNNPGAVAVNYVAGEIFYAPQ